MAEQTKRTFNLESRLIEFASMVIDITEALPQCRVGNHISAQLIRCGLSPAPNYGEAQGAESRNDFTHKMRFSLKELQETRVWLLIIRRKALIRTCVSLGASLRATHQRG